MASLPGKNDIFDLRNRKSVVAATSTPATNGLPAGGDAGEILAKIDGTDYNAEWIPNFTPQVKHLVKNGSGAAMTKGQVVYISGADGTNMLVSLADADMDETSATTIGLLEQDLAINAHGYVVTEGLLAGLDTSTATAGDPVWLSSTPGGKIYGLTNKPVAPVHLVYLGVVTRVQSNNGEIFISVNNGWELNELHNVLADNTPADNEVLAYDSASSLWKNQTASEAGLATSTHVHGNITNAGLLSTSVTATNPVKVVITDSGDVLGTLSTTNASATTFLRGDGTWVTPTGTYTLPDATTSIKGGVIVGSTFTVSSGTINLPATGVTAGSYTATNLTVDAYGRITAASNGTISNFSGLGTSVTGISAAAGVALPISTSNVTTGTVGALSLTGGNTSASSGSGGAINITGGNQTNTSVVASGGNVTIKGGTGNSTQGVGGSVTIDGGLGSSANGNGSVSIGTGTGSDSVIIGKSGGSTTINGTLTAVPTFPSTAKQLFLASPTGATGTPTFRYISTSDFTQYASPSLGQALVAAPVTGGWAWSTFMSPSGATMTGGLTLAAGTTSVNPIRFTANTSLPTVATGTMDYDGKAFYAVPDTTGDRALLPATHLFANQTSINVVGTSTGGATVSGNAFGVSLPLATSTAYELEGVFYLQTSYSVYAPTAQTLGFTAPTGSTVLFNGSIVQNQTTQTAQTTTISNFALTTGTRSLTAVTTSGNWHRIEIRGIVRTSTTAGSFSITFGGTNGATPATLSISLAANSFLKLTPIGSATSNNSIGAWA